MPAFNFDDALRVCNAASLPRATAESFWTMLQQIGAQYNVLYDAQRDFGCAGNDSTDDRVNMQAALDQAGQAAASGAGKVAVFCAPGKYIVPRAGNNVWCLKVPAGVEIVGIPGASWWKQPVGMPAVTAPIALVSEVDGVTFRGMGFDGNWGAVVGVTDTLTGINHADQGINPTLHGIMFRGATNCAVLDCRFRQTYGDALYFGAGANNGAASVGIRVERCVTDITARHALGYVYARDNSISHCRFLNCFSGTVDVEPVNTFKSIRDVSIHKTLIDRWWSDTIIRFPLTIVGSDVAPMDGSAVRGFRVTECDIRGPVLIGSAYDVLIEGGRITADYATASYAPLLIDHVAEGVVVRDVEVYDRGGASGDNHIAAVQIRHYGTIYKPNRVILDNVRVKARAGRAAFAIDGAGGVRGDAGTATSVTATTLGDTTKNWTADQFAGALVRMGGKVAAIASNTGGAGTSALTLFGWETPPNETGVSASTPATGAYEILARDGNVVLENCHADCSNDGWGQGGVGLYIDAGDTSGKACNVELKVNGLTVVNAQGDGVQVQSRTSNPIRHLEFRRVHVKDNQATPTCTVGIRFNTSPAVSITKAIISDLTLDGVANAFAGVGSASPNLIKWLVRDGEAQEWEGFGAPGFTAPKGSRYWRKDGGASTTFYVNEAGTSSWRAV